MKRMLATLVVTVFVIIAIELLVFSFIKIDDQTVPPSAMVTELTYSAVKASTPNAIEPQFYSALADKVTGRFVDYADPNLYDYLAGSFEPADYSQTLPGFVQIVNVIFENWDCYILQDERWDTCDYNRIRIADVDTWDSSIDYRYINSPVIPTELPTEPPPLEDFPVLFNVKITGENIDLRYGLYVRSCGASLYNDCRGFYFLTSCSTHPELYPKCTNDGIPVYEVKYKSFSTSHPLDAGWWLNVVCPWNSPSCSGNYWIPACLDDGRNFVDWCETLR